MCKLLQLIACHLQKLFPVCFVFSQFLFSSINYGQDLPLGYISHYSQKANSTQFLSTLNICTPQYWNIANDKSSTVLYPAVRDSIENRNFLLNMGVIKDMIFGEFILELDFRSSSPDSGVAGFCFLGPVKNPDTYYLFVLGHDSVTFFYVNKGIPEIIESKYLIVRNNSWNHVRVTRDILKRSVTFVLNKDPRTQVVFTDPRLVMGYTGFGTYITQSSIRNIDIWAPTAITDTTFTCR